MIFTLADRWGEPDPRKIAALPASILQHWRAFFALDDPAPPKKPHTETEPPLPALLKSDVEAQCADVMRKLNL
ncbi:hypothetical protein EYY85_08815 [Hafnia paralvei]|nr:hypothetical protein EYY85_08815 [Hafnia paralvei]